MEEGTETLEDGNNGVLSQMRNKACTKEAEQGKNSPCVGLSQVCIQKQATRAEAGAHTESD